MSKPPVAFRGDDPYPEFVPLEFDCYNIVDRFVDILVALKIIRRDW